MVRVRHRIDARATLRCPLLSTGGTPGQFPFVAEQVPEEVVAPLRRGGGPGDLQAAANGVTADAGAKTALPAQALLLDAGRFGLCAYKFCITSAVGFSKGMSACDEGNRFFVVHC